MSKIIVEFGDRLPAPNEPYFRLGERCMELTADECSRIKIGSPLLQKYLDKCGVQAFAWAKVFGISFSGNDSVNLLSLQSILDSLRKIKSNPSLIEEDQGCRINVKAYKENNSAIIKIIDCDPKFLNKIKFVLFNRPKSIQLKIKS